MPTILRSVLPFLLVLCVSQVCAAPTMHVISVATTTERDIGKGVGLDESAFFEAMRGIATAAEMTLEGKCQKRPSGIS